MAAPARLERRVTWLRPDEAAKWLEVSVRTVYVVAHREGWRKAGAGSTTRYALDDVGATKEARLDRRCPRHQPPADDTSATA